MNVTKHQRSREHAEHVVAARRELIWAHDLPRVTETLFRVHVMFHVDGETSAVCPVCSLLKWEKHLRWVWDEEWAWAFRCDGKCRE